MPRYDLRIHISRLGVIVVLHYPLHYSAKIGISQGFYIVAPENVITGRFLTPTEHGDKYRSIPGQAVHGILLGDIIQVAQHIVHMIFSGPVR